MVGTGHPKRASHFRVRSSDRQRFIAQISTRKDMVQAQRGGKSNTRSECRDVGDETSTDLIAYLG